MQIHPDTVSPDRQPRLLTFARSDDAQLFAVRTDLTSVEASRLRSTLDSLIEIGALALYRFDTPVLETENLEQITGHLREVLGGVCVDAAFGAAHWSASATPQPQTLVPVWPFERMAADSAAFVAYGLFMRMPIAFEALPVSQTDPMDPAPEARARFHAWRRALGRNAMLGTVVLPGHDDAHVIIASVQAG